MLYRESNQLKQPFINNVFRAFCEAVASGPTWKFADIVYSRFVIEDFAYSDDSHYFNVLNYFEQKVVPHKVAVYKAGQSFSQLEGFYQLIRITREEWYDQLWLHDISKFSAEEAFGYAFYDFKTKTGKEAFDLAWHHHKTHNPHHPEYWHSVNRDGSTKLLEMPVHYVAEMVADWIGAGETYGQSLQDWLPQNLPTFILHEKSQLHLRRVLNLIGFEIELIEGRLHVKGAVEQVLPK